MTKKTSTANVPAASTIKAADAYARKINREYGPCTVVRAVAQRYPSLRRRDVLGIAGALKINPGTAARQFFLSRSGQIEVTGV